MYHTDQRPRSADFAGESARVFFVRTRATVCNLSFT